MNLSIQNRDRCLVGVTFIAATISCGWFFTHHVQRIRTGSQPKRNAPASAAAITLRTIATPSVTPPRWPGPLPQKQGNAWLFDVFTPPEIRYDRRTGEFTARERDVAESRHATISAPRADGLKLLAVERALFRVQLIGYAISSDGVAVGFFENAETKETFTATTGNRLSALGLFVQAVDVRRETQPIADSTVTRDVAQAEVRDERTGKITTLTSTTRCFTTESTAVVSVSAGSVTPRNVRQGDVIETDRRSYRVTKIQFDPAAVELVHESAETPIPEIRTLTLHSDELTASALPPP